MPVEENPACRSRRSFLQVSAAAAAVAAGYRILTEPMLAHLKLASLSQSLFKRCGAH